MSVRLTSHELMQAQKEQKVCKQNLQTFVLLVRLAGFEPTTPWFVAKYSIQLSYSRRERNYSMFLAWM